MICARLVGGLGNQLHILAAGLAIASKNDAPLLLDVSLLKNEFVTAREYELEPFINIVSQLYPIKVVNFNGVDDEYLKNLLVHHFNQGFEIWRDLEVDPQSQLKMIPNNSIIRGHFLNFTWADLAYSAGFTKNLLSNIDASLDSDFLPNQINIHIRLGDFLRNRHIIPKIPSCYFHEAIAMFNLEEKVYIYTDDIKMLSLQYPLVFLRSDRVFTPRKNDTLASFKMLSQGKMIVTSNSTFSTWAAWFSNSKYIFTPIPHMINVPWEDSLPENWIRFDMKSRNWI